MPRNSSAVVTATAVFLLLPPALAGCSSHSIAAPPGVDIAAANRDQIKNGGTLRWAIDEMPATFNVFQADATKDTARVVGAVLPALFTLDEQGSPQRNADYLSSASVTRTEPRQVVRYEINPKAVWSTGEHVTARDFAAQWAALNGRNSAYWTSRNAGYDRIEKVSGSDGGRVVNVTFRQPYADWRSLFSPLYPASVTGSPAAFNDQSRKGLPATAGPFRIKQVDRAAGQVTLSRSSKWWGDAAKLDALAFRAVPARRRPATMAAGGLDIATVDPEMARSAAGIRGWTVRRAAGAAAVELTLNGSAGPLSDERVRRAVARSIDRQAIAEAVLKPLDLPAMPLGNHLLMASQKGYRNNSSVLGRNSTGIANAILYEAGWRPEAATAQAEPAPAAAPARPVPGQRRLPAHLSRVALVEPEALRQKKGKPLALRLLVPKESGTLRGVGKQVAKMLAKIGARTEVVQVAGNAFFRDHVAAGEFDLALFSWPATAYPATDARPIYAKPLPAADGSARIEQNYARVGTDEIDQLFARGIADLGPAAVQDLATRADARIWAVAHSVPLYQRPELVALSSGTVNAGAFGLSTPRYQDIGFRKGK